MNENAARAEAKERTLRALQTGGDRLVVACSGGADSSLLTLLVAEAGVRARVVNVHHGLTAQADEGSERARAIAERCGLPYAQLGVDGGAIRADKRGLEAAARAARYAAIRGEIEPGERVVTAHTATDRIATVLMRLAQGAGLPALAGPRERGVVLGVPVLRPMLHWWREQVEQSLRSYGWEPWCDPDNATRQRLRNRVEQDLVGPLLQLADHGALGRSLEQIARDAAQLERYRSERLNSLSRQAPDGSLFIGRAAFGALDPAEQVGIVAVALRELGVRASQAMIERFALALSTGRAAVARGARLEAGKGWSRLAATRQSRAPLPRLEQELALEFGPAPSHSISTPWGDLDVRVWDGTTLPRGLGGAVIAVSAVRGGLALRVVEEAGRARVVVRDSEGELWCVGEVRSSRARVMGTAEEPAVSLGWRWYDGLPPLLAEP